MEGVYSDGLPEEPDIVLPAVKGNPPEIPLESKRVGVANSLGILSDEVARYFSACPRDPRTFAVYLCVLNACRACRFRTIRFDPRWHQGAGIGRRAAVRGLDRLESAKLITQIKSKGHSPKVTLLDDISYHLR